MNQKNEKICFGWGNPYFLLEILDKTYKQKLSPYDINGMSYAPNRGVKGLIDLTINAIKETTGLEYKYIVITNGATHAINTLLRMYGSRTNDDGTRKNTHIYTFPYGYPYYKEMFRRAGYKRIIQDQPRVIKSIGDGIELIDSPSNPMGWQTKVGTENTIWDAVYHNKIYTEDLERYPTHGVMVGSYSKLLGLTGARVGWIATNNLFTAILATDWSLKDNATVSVPSQELIIDILRKIDLHKFIQKGKNYLDANREEFQKIEYLFDRQPVQKVGMFYCANADHKFLNCLKNVVLII